jgi:hypothetical protein
LRVILRRLQQPNARNPTLRDGGLTTHNQHTLAEQETAAAACVSEEPMSLFAGLCPQVESTHFPKNSCMDRAKSGNRRVNFWAKGERAQQNTQNLAADESISVHVRPHRLFINFVIFMLHLKNMALDVLCGWMSIQAIIDIIILVGT